MGGGGENRREGEEGVGRGGVKDERGEEGGREKGGGKAGGGSFGSGVGKKSEEGGSPAQLAALAPIELAEWSRRRKEEHFMCGGRNLGEALVG